MNVTETMDSVRWMMEKYQWMAADSKQPLPRNVKDFKFRATMTEQEVAEIKRLHKTGMRMSHIAKQVNRSFSSVLRTVRGRSYKDILAEREAKLEEWKLSYRLDNGRSPTPNRINEMRKAMHAEVINRYK